MTPSLKLRPCSSTGPAPLVISTLPPPMSTTTSTSPAPPTPYEAAKWMSRASSVPEMTCGRIAVCTAMARRNSPPFSASRTALVATATISSTPWESARRRNLDITWRAARIASGVNARPSSPPAPSRTISFSRSMTSNDKSARTRATIMCSELVPMSMAASRTVSSAFRQVRAFHYNQGLHARPSRPFCIMPPLRQRHDLLRPRLDRFTRMLPGVEAGEVEAIHHIRVATRRLRELLPILQQEGRKAGKLGDRLRKANRRLGRVRELDVLLVVIRELKEGHQHSDKALSRIAAIVSDRRAAARSALARGPVVAELRRIARQLEAVAASLPSTDNQSRQADRWWWA